MRSEHSRVAFAALDNVIERHYMECMRKMTEKTANNQIAYVVSLYNQYVREEDWFAAEELLDLYPGLVNYGVEEKGIDNDYQ